MPRLKVIQGGRDCSLKDDTADFQYDQADEGQFGPPPSILVGFLTSLVGAAAGIVSLLIYFKLFDPASYISRDWLIFVFAGAAAGIFLRVEHPFIQEIEGDSN